MNRIDLLEVRIYACTCIKTLVFVESLCGMVLVEFLLEQQILRNINEYFHNEIFSLNLRPRLNVIV